MSNKKSGIRLFGQAPTLIRPGGLSASSPGQLLQQALAHAQSGRSRDAETALLALLKLQPSNFDALQLLGTLYLKTRRWDAGVDMLRQAIRAQPGFAPAHNNLSIGLRELGLVDESVSASRQALTLKPDYLEAKINLGNTLRHAQRLDDATAHYHQALTEHPEEARLLLGLGLTQQDQGDLSSAANSLRLALERQPDLIEARYALGAVLEQDGQAQIAIDTLAPLLELWPHHARGWNVRGLALHSLRRLPAARQAFQQAIASDPEAADAYANLAALLEDMGAYEEALASYRRALQKGADRALILRQVGDLQASFRHYEAALTTFTELCQEAPETAFAQAGLLIQKLRCFDWNGLEALRQQLHDDVLGGQQRIQPFDALAFFDDPAVHQQAALQDVSDRRPPDAALWPECGEQDRTVRLAYVSADFHEHATMHLMKDVFECHDRTRFELTAVTLGPPLEPERQAWLHAHFDRVIDGTGVDDRTLIERLRALKLDLAVDLKGHTRDARFDLFHQRIAPIQVSYLGHPGPCGSPSIDYVLGDAIVTPFEHQVHYLETIWQLPGAYQANGRLEPRPLEPETGRQKEGLPEEGFVFACFNNSYKITPELFEIWCQLLDQVAGSVLWLLGNDAAAEERLRAQARLRGVDGERIVFAPRRSRQAHLARHGLADLFLDTLPYGAHTTASDVLRMRGVMVTCQGRSFPARVGSSLLHAIGCPQLVTQDLDGYRALALRLALDPALLASQKLAIAQGVECSELFKPECFTRHLETAYLGMLARRSTTFAA